MQNQSGLKIISKQLKNKQCQEFWDMLCQAADHTGLPRSRVYKGCKEKQGKSGYAAFDGIYLDNDDLFWCGIIHHENYKEKECFYIVFAPEGNNSSRYQYDALKASHLMKNTNNYHVEIPKAGTWLPEKSNKFPRIRTTVVIKANLQKHFLERPDFDSLPDWNSQRDWLSNFMKKAYDDMEQFKV